MKVKKSIQAIDLILNLSKNREIAYIKLIKLVYLIDRAFIQLHGKSLTGDRYVSMRLGPVTSDIYNYIKDLKIYPKDTNKKPMDYWENYFQISDNYYIQATKERNSHLILSNTLEKEEKIIINEAVECFKDYDYKQMINYTHENCKEWIDPFPFRCSDIEFDDIVYWIEEGNKLYPFKTQ